MTMRRLYPGAVVLMTMVLALGATACAGPRAAASAARVTARASRSRSSRSAGASASASASPEASSAAEVRAGGVCQSAAHPALAARISRGISAALRGRQSVAAVSANDPALGLTCALHPWWEFHSASVVKVIILAALLRDQQLQGAGLTAAQDELATEMITESDNAAASALWAQVGMARLRAFLAAAGMSHTVLGQDGYWGLTEVNAHDELTLLRLLVTSNAVLDSASRTVALRLMSQVVAAQRWGVSADAPADVTVHLKNGWLPDPDLWVINSIGDFTSPGGAYSIAILTRENPTMDYGVDTVQAVASVINGDLAAR
jgi:hypothetical protein